MIGCIDEEQKRRWIWEFFKSKSLEELSPLATMARNYLRAESWTGLFDGIAVTDWYKDVMGLEGIQSNLLRRGKVYPLELSPDSVPDEELKAFLRARIDKGVGPKMIRDIIQKRKAIDWSKWRQEE